MDIFGWTSHKKLDGAWTSVKILVVTFWSQEFLFLFSQFLQSCEGESVFGCNSASHAQTFWHKSRGEQHYKSSQVFWRGIDLWERLWSQLCPLLVLQWCGYKCILIYWTKHCWEFRKKCKGNSYYLKIALSRGASFTCLLPLTFLF